MSKMMKTYCSSGENHGGGWTLLTDPPPQCCCGDTTQNKARGGQHVQKENTRLQNDGFLP